MIRSMASQTAGRAVPASGDLGRRARLVRFVTTDRGLFCLALAVRLGLTAVYSHQHVTITGLELGTLADNILAGRGFVWEFYGSTVPRFSFFPPFYPAFLALLKLLFGPEGWVLAMQVVQAFVSAGAAVATRRLAARVLGAGSSAAAGTGAAGVAVALWPPLVIYSASAYSVTFEALATPWIVLLLFDAGRSRRFADAAKAGVGYGLLAYALPAFLGSIVVVPAAFRVMGVRWRRAIGLTIIMLLVALAVILPWTVRNALIHHRFVPVATNIGFNYLGGQNPYARSYSNILCAYDDLRWKVIDRQALEMMNEADFDRSLLRQGLAYAVANPGLTARRSAERLLYYWWGSPELLRYNPDQGLGHLIVMSIVLPLFAIGLWHSRTAPERFVLLYAVFIWQSLFYMNFAIRGRYAMPTHPLMLIMAVLGAAAIGRFFRRRSPEARSRPLLGA